MPDHEMPDEARYIWIDPNGEGRNRWALLRREFTLAGEPAGGVLNIFADTRYRLLVNGLVVCHGPARFFACRPEYDTVDLLPYLRRGPNAIAIIVNSYGCVSFHSEVSVGGLIAWGEAADEAGNTVRIATDETWRAVESAAHRRDTPTMSFALNPAEVQDARALPEGWDRPGFDETAWPAAVLHGHPDHWGPLRERSIPMLDEREVLPRRRLGTWVARPAADEIVHSLFVLPPGGRSLYTRTPVAVMTWIHSPRDQRVTMGVWWGRYWVNGQEVRPAPRKDLGWRQDLTADLHEGWNHLEVRESVSQGWWDFYLGLPRAAGLAVSAEKEHDSLNVFLIAGPWAPEKAAMATEMPAPLGAPSALPEELGPWQRWPRGKDAGTACRERAWRRFEPLAVGPSTTLRGADYAEQVGSDTLVVLYDFGGEVLGRPVIEFDAAAGTVVDVTYCERLRDDGTSDVHGQHFVDMVERCIAREGAQTWQTFHPRGFRYLEVLVRGDLSAFTLHRVSLHRATYPVEPIGRFACSDPVLNEAWMLGEATLRACMEDAYLDCPWRERGLYSGDFVVQFFSNLATFGDTVLFGRCIDMFLAGQGPEGYVPGNAHGGGSGGGGDYAAVVVHAAWYYWARTGDVESVREWAGPLKKLLEALHAAGRTEDGLHDASVTGGYIDLCHMDKTGVNCALNCFSQRAFECGARLFEALGDEAASERYADEAEHLAAGIREAFWDEERGVFTDRRPADAPQTAPSVPANALPLMFGIASDEQASRAVEWLAEAMANNFRVPEPAENEDCNVTSYFSFYALGALYSGEADVEAEAFMRTYWGRMLDAGAWTCWEYFVDNASRCHAWSSAPTHYLSSHVLGVTFPEPGNPNVVSIWPYPGTLQWAEGIYPHPAGPIHVSWHVEAGQVMLEYFAPDGVEVIVEPPAG